MRGNARHRGNKRVSSAALALVLFAAGWPAAFPAEPDITVVLSHDTLPYRDAYRGLDAVLKGAGRTVYPLVLDEADDPAQTRKLDKRAGTEAIALGERALEFVRKNRTSQPAVVCLALNDAGRPGVTLAYLPVTRLEMVRQLLPFRVTVGALYIDDAIGRKDISSLQAAAHSLGMQLAAYPIDAQYPLDSQLERLSNKFDILIGTYDLRIFSASHAQSILLFSYRHRIPLFGLSDAWTRAGAIMSLDWDFEDIGRQCGEIALKELHAPASIGKEASPPRHIVYSLNLRAASYFKIEFDESVQKHARRIFK